MFWKWEMPTKRKLYLFKSYYMPVLTYGSKTWTLTKADISRLMAAEIRFLRGIEGKTQKRWNKKKKIVNLLINTGRQRNK
jgi:hypothetical protein